MGTPVTLALKIILLLVVLLVIASAVLRIRKLRRDEIRELSKPVERRLMSPPPSPYEPSKGFRLLDGPLEASRRPEPTRPRLEADREFVFSETQLPGDDPVVATHLRHSEEWALSKSARRSGSITGLRVAVIALLVVLIVGAIGLYLEHHKTPPKTPTTTTTVKHSTATIAKRSSSTTTVAFGTLFTMPSVYGATFVNDVINSAHVIVVGANRSAWFAR